MKPKEVRQAGANKPEAIRKVASEIPGYAYGTPEAATSPVSLSDLELLKKTVNFTEEDQTNTCEWPARCSRTKPRKW